MLIFTFNRIIDKARKQINELAILSNCQIYYFNVMLKNLANIITGMLFKMISILYLHRVFKY